MEILKRFADIHVGDVVRRSLNDPVTERVLRVVHSGVVVRLLLSPETGIEHWSEGHCQWQIVLVHRPYSEGKTEQDMLDAVEVALKQCVYASIENDGRSVGAIIELSTRYRYPPGFDNRLRALREAIEAWELGKPEEADGG